MMEIMAKTSVEAAVFMDFHISGADHVVIAIKAVAGLDAIG
jgi:hypothetical protein